MGQRKTAEDISPLYFIGSATSHVFLKHPHKLLVNSSLLMAGELYSFEEHVKEHDDDDEDDEDRPISFYHVAFGF